MQRQERIGLHHYPTVENEKYLSGTCDLYYGHKKYYEARATWLLTGNKQRLEEMNLRFHRVQYLIYKTDNIPTEIILLDKGLQMDWDTEIQAGLDYLYVQHLWPAPHDISTAYRFANGFHLDPIGKICWTAPDLFYWSKQHNERINKENTPCQQSTSEKC